MIRVDSENINSGICKFKVGEIVGYKQPPNLGNTKKAKIISFVKITELERHFLNNPGDPSISYDTEKYYVLYCIEIKDVYGKTIIVEEESLLSIKELKETSAIYKNKYEETEKLIKEINL